MAELADNKLNITKQKELYVATLVHDLKNPLNAQIIALEQFSEEKFGSINKLQKDILLDIISSSKFMREMLSSLLSVYKLDNGVVKLDKNLVDVDILIQKCIRNISTFAEYNSICIEYHNLSQSTIIPCDENYIRRVISNMLFNIVIYSYKNTKAVITLKEDYVSTIISFRNNGFPIDDKLQIHIFDKYTLGKNTKSGTGLGLYFCKKVVEAHGGIITLNANKSDIEFCIKLPKNKTGEDTIKFN